MPQKKKIQSPIRKSISKTSGKKNNDPVDMISHAMLYNLNKIKNSEGVKKAKKMLFSMLGGVRKAVQQFVDEHPLTPEQQRMLYKEMKRIAQGTGAHGIDVDFEDNFGGVF